MRPTGTWQRLGVGSPCERIIVFRVPSSERIVMASYEGVYDMRDLRLSEGPSIDEDRERPEDYDAEDGDHPSITVGGVAYPAHGLLGECPCPTTSDGLSLRVHQEALSVEVVAPTGEVVLVVHEDFPSGGIAACFSADGRLLVVATPNSLFAYRR